LSLLVSCRRCGASYARVLLDPEGPARCRCGDLLDTSGPEPHFVDGEALHAEEAKLRELSRAADQVCSMIVASDCPRIDVDIQRAELRRRARRLFPDKMELYEMIYESRFRRLWEQFRAER
jgi:hypothetical protein